MSEHKEPASTKGTNITRGIFSFVVFVLFLPQIIQFFQAPPANWDGFLIALILNIYSTSMLVTRPLTNLMNVSVVGAVPALELFRQAMPAAEGWLDVTYSQVGGIANYMVTYALNNLILVLPFLLLLGGAIRAGANAKSEESGAGVGMKFAAKLTLGGIAGYAVVWGVLGAVAGTWDAILGGFKWFAPLIIFGNLVAASWTDIVFVIVLSVILGAAGKAMGKKQVIKKEQKPAQVIAKEAQMAEAQAPLLVPAPRVAAAARAGEAEARYVVQNFCELCGTRIDPRGVFCPGCGARMRKEAPEPEVAPETKAPPTAEAMTAQQTKKQKQMQDLEKGIAGLNRYSSTWAIFFTILSIITASIAAGVTGDAYKVLAAVFAVPCGLFAVWRDQQVFQGKVWKKNYSSRGIDMMIVGMIGNVAGGAGFLIFLKGLLMCIYTTQKTTEYPRLTAEQWEARIYQEVNVYGAPLMGLYTISVAAEFALFPLAPAWVIMKLMLGAFVYYAYINYVKQDLVQGNFLNAEEKCLLLGAVGCIVNGGGFLILMQGLILYLHRTNKLEKLAKKPAVETPARSEQ